MSVTRRPCPACDNPTTGTLCWTCVTAIRGHLARIPTHATELTTQLARQSRTTPPTDTPARAADRPLPYNPHAAEILTHLRRLLDTWTLVVLNGQPWPPETPRNPTTQAARIGAAPWHTHPDAPEILADLDRLADRIHQCIDTPPERRYLGPCGSVLEDGTDCPGDVYQLGTKPPTCRHCRATHAADQRLAWIADLAADQLVTAHDAAGALSAWGAHITADLIRQWASRGRLLPRGHDRAGHTVYRFEDCRGLALESIKRRRKTSA